MRRSLTLLVLLAAGCRKAPPPPAAIVDAGVDAHVAEAPKAWGAQILARSIAHPSFHWLDERELVLEMGMYFHTVDEKGVVARIGKLEDYARFLPENDDDLVGYDVEQSGESSRVSGSKARLFVKHIYPDHVMLWDGATWSKTVSAPPPPFIGRSTWLSDPKSEGVDAGSALLPADKSYRVFSRVRDGRVVWLPSPSEANQDIAIIDKDKKEVRHVRAIEPQRDAKGEAAFSCDNIPSLDETVWLSCEEHDPDWNERFKRKLHVVRLEGDAFREIALPEIAEGTTRASFAVDPAATLWFAENGASEVKLVRIPKSGVAEKLDIPQSPPGLARPFYTSLSVATRAKATGDSPYRSWALATIREPLTPDRMRSIDRIVPRPSGDVLVVARDPDAAKIVVRFARGAEPTPVDRIVLSGTRPDQRNEIRNTRPPRSWVGHCPQIFVIVKAEKLLAHEGELEQLLAKSKRTKRATPQMTIIEGTLGGKPVQGVAVVRTYPEIREDDVEALASRIIERFTTDPASPPDATCTLPVLTKVHKDWRPTSDDPAF